jgi:hypothetical protein
MKKNSLSKKLLLAALLFLFMIINTKAQTINDAFASIADTTGQNNIFTLQVSDSTGISAIEVRLGSNPSDSDLVFHLFTFDSQPASPYSYNRSGNTIKLGLGTVTQNYSYYGEARLKYPNGTWSNSFQFISN